MRSGVYSLWSCAHRPRASLRAAPHSPGTPPRDPAPSAGRLRGGRSCAERGSRSPPLHSGVSDGRGSVVPHSSPEPPPARAPRAGQVIVRHSPAPLASPDGPEGRGVVRPCFRSPVIWRAARWSVRARRRRARSDLEMEKATRRALFGEGNPDGLEIWRKRTSIGPRAELI